MRQRATKVNALRANGPGLRAVLWVQGCTLGCPGCFNPGTHDHGGGLLRDTVELAAELLSQGNRIEGISVSGGEPFQQPEALLDLLRRLDGSGLSRLAFSGYTLREIEDQALGPAILLHLAVLARSVAIACAKVAVGTRAHDLSEIASRIPLATVMIGGETC